MITLRRVGIATAIALAVTAAPSVPVGAETTSVSGTFVFDHAGSTCKGPPRGYGKYTDYDPFIISGDLEGCWYTKVDEAWDLGAPTGLYFEVGREVFVGRFRDGPEGTLSTVYTFQSQWDPDVTTGEELWGHCQHLIVRGSRGLRDVTGYLERTDVVTDGSGVYEGFVDQP